MRLSASAEALLAEFRKGATWSERFFGNDRRRVSLIEQLAATGDIAAIPHLLWLVAGSSPLADAAAGAVEVLLSDARAEELIAVDAAVRTMPQYGAWWEQSQRDVRRYESNVSLKVLSFHRNGFIRETAVERLAETSDHSEVPFLLLRLNDWVPQVRDAAMRAIRSRLTNNYAADYVRWLPLVSRLVDAKRADHASFLDALTKLLRTTPSARAAISRLLVTGSAANRRALFHLLLQGNVDADLAVVAVDSVDPVMRLWAVRVASDLSLLLRSRRDRSPKVRAEALMRVAKLFPAEALPLLREAVMDRSAFIRDFARFELRKTQTPDVAKVYRDVVSSGKTVAMLSIAINGLEEVGTKSDASLVASFLHHRSSRVRRAAVRALARLDAGAYLDDFVDAVCDPAPSVSGAARNALRRHIGSVGLPRLASCYENGAPHVRRNVVELFAAGEKWEALDALLRALRDADDDLAISIRDHLRHWNAEYNRTQSVPTTAQLQSITHALDHVADSIPRLADDIRFALSSFR